MENFNTRYARHYSLKDFGVMGQQKLSQAKVLVIGAGGLGCPVLQYLTAAGVGKIGIADHDTISISNLQRQVLYSTDDVGKSKVHVAAVRLKALNPEIVIVTYDLEISSANAFEIITQFDIVIDCTDNFAACYLINDACALLDKPLIFAAIYQYEGQLAVFNCLDHDGIKTNYRNLFSTPPNPLEVLNCNENGVLGVLPGIIGVMQAAEAIKLITGVGEVLMNKLLTFNLLTYSVFVIDITADHFKDVLIPLNKSEFESTNYKWLCDSSDLEVATLDAFTFLERINGEDTMVIDVRESDELPKPTFTYRNIPLSRLNEKISELTAPNIILFCQSGKRSLKAAELLIKEFGYSKNISHLQGGILKLQEL